MPNWKELKPSMVFHCDDVRATVDGFAARGVPITEPPKDMAWGTYAQLVDPDGNVFLVMTPKPVRSTDQSGFQLLMFRGGRGSSDSFELTRLKFDAGKRFGASRNDCLEVGRPRYRAKRFRKVSQPASRARLLLRMRTPTVITRTPLTISTVWRCRLNRP